MLSASLIVAGNLASSAASSVLTAAAFTTDCQMQESLSTTKAVSLLCAL
ncbi:hypothetical protein HX773_24785 [Pantoea sp. B9002]|nr:hypothetical protein [Pantoea sp. B9002]NWA64117.1 hypothetical protein [Pantoea sp. B9002]